MKRISIVCLSAVAFALSGYSQNALDAYQLSQGDLRGTARFMSMAGAFTALGGDLSTLGQNPGGIGVYRSSEIGATLDINIQGVSSDVSGAKLSQNQTKVSCDNLGYIGAMNLGSASVMPYINWGVSYSRAASFNRRYKGAASGVLNGSLSNYVAGYSGDWTPAELNGYVGNYDPFQSTYAPWMSILLYNAYAINPSNPNSSDYKGLYNGSSAGKMTFDVEEKGYIDEYSLNVGGNILNTVYWGIGFGITDLDYRSNVFYSESFADARISNSAANGYTTGEAAFGLQSYKHISGTGFNFKAGVIVKPINEFRIGLAVHTPTYYNLDYDDWGQTEFSYGSGHEGYFPNTSTYGNCHDYFSWKLRSPWRLMLGVAGVVGKKAIVSVDYEMRAYDNMRVKDNSGEAYTNMTEDIKNWYRTQNILRLGVEYRLTSQVSARVGYSWQSSPVKTEAKEGELPIYTSGPGDTGTQPSFSFDNTTQYITCGLGWHYKNFYADAAYVHRHRSSTWKPYTNYAQGTEWVESPVAKLSDNQNSIVISAGFKF